MKQDLKHIIFLVLKQQCFKALCFQFHKSNVAWWPWMIHKITFWCGNAVFHLITSIKKKAQIANSHDTCINRVISKLNACHKDPNIYKWFWDLVLDFGCSMMMRPCNGFWNCKLLSSTNFWMFRLSKNFPPMTALLEFCIAKIPQ